MEVGDPVALTIGGKRLAGADGSYPVVNPARPDQTVLMAPIASAAQLDNAVAEARSSQPAWAASALRRTAGRPPGRLRRGHDLARPGRHQRHADP